jgi:hypothetical protein
MKFHREGGRKKVGTGAATERDDRKLGNAKPCARDSFAWRAGLI